MSIRDASRGLFAKLSGAIGRLGPGWQRLIWAGIPAILLIVLVSRVVPMHQPPVADGRAAGKGNVGSVLLNGSEGDDTIHSLASAVQRLERSQEQTARELGTLKETVDSARRAAAAMPPPAPPGAPDASTAGAPLSPPPAPAAAGGPSRPAGTPNGTPNGPAGGTAAASKPGYAVRPGADATFWGPAGPPAGEQIAYALAPGAVWGTRGAAPGMGAEIGQAGSSAGTTGPAPPVQPIVHVFKQEAVATTPRGGNRPEEFRPEYDLPPGAIVSGVLLTGMDAPTSLVARRDPMPALLRIKQTTILPNLREADQRECFVLLSGYGDLSAERAYLRAEDLSCVLADGSTFDERIEGYVVDESGKVGVRGKVVSKQGAFIARSLAVGIMQGIAEAFGRNQNYGIGLSQGGQLSFQQAGDQTTGGAVAGAAKGLDRIADFYLQQAVAMFPVIEVGAERQLDLVLTKAVRVKLPGGMGD